MKKFLKILNFVFNSILTFIIIIGIVFISLYIIGIEPSVVQSGSMEPQIQTGSLCFINKLVKYEEIKENDVIAFKLPTGVGVTHRVIKINADGFTTKGDNNETEDLIKTTKENYIGKNVFSIPKVGYIIKLLQTPRGKIIFGTLILVIFLAGILIGEPSKKKQNKVNKMEKNNLDTNASETKEENLNNKIKKDNINNIKQTKDLNSYIQKEDE